MRRPIYTAAILIVVGVLALAGCSSGSNGASTNAVGNKGGSAQGQSTTATGAKPVAGATTTDNTAGKTMGNSTEKSSTGKDRGRTGFPKVAAGTKAIPAFAGLRKAGSAAADWQKDAKLYAIASVVPKVDVEGRNPAWLYTYVSASAGAVKSIMVDGGKVRSLPEQKVPKESLNVLERKALPAPDKLIDSPEAMKRSNEVRKFLEKNPGAKASAGLDATSTPKPVWFLATVNGTRRIEEKVPATSGGS